MRKKVVLIVSLVVIMSTISLQVQAYPPAAASLFTLR